MTQEQAEGNGETAKTTVEATKVPKTFVSFKVRAERDATESVLPTVDIKDICEVSAALPTVDTEEIHKVTIAFKAKTEYNGQAGWCVDSGATSHMTNNKQFFSSLQGINSSVYLADKSVIAATGIGDGFVDCVTPTGIQKVHLEEVLFLPELDDQLISVKKIIKKGLEVNFKNGAWFVFQRNDIVAEIIDDDDLFRLKVQNQETARTVKKEACIHQWHRRLEHRDPAAIKRLVNEDLATGIKISRFSEEVTCEECIKGKLSQKKFTPVQERYEEPLQLVHSDVCGPMQKKIPNENRYFLTIIDDYSRFTVVRLMKTKDEVTNIIKKYVAAMSTQIG